MIRLLIAGEGSNEIGDLTVPFLEGERPSGGGVIEAFVGKVRPAGWRVRCALRWKDVRKLKPNLPHQGEERTVRGLALQARELGCNALIFLRDRDGDLRREREIRESVRSLDAGAVHVAAGIPIEKLECWLLALCGEAAAHKDPDPVSALRDRHGVPAKATSAMVQLLRKQRLQDLSPDAISLRGWLQQVAVAVNVKRMRWLL
jgi:hypothetical protein